MLHARSMLVGGAFARLIIFGLAQTGYEADHAQTQQSRTAANLVASLTRLIQSPDTVIDLSEVSGYYCLNTGLVDDGFMVHFTIEPEGTVEQIVSFHRPETLKAAGFELAELPRLPEELGERRRSHGLERSARKHTALFTGRGHVPSTEKGASVTENSHPMQKYWFGKQALPHAKAWYDFYRIVGGEGVLDKKTKELIGVAAGARMWR